VKHFTRPFVIRWADCDANGHLRNTCYSEYAIEVRMAFLASHGFGLKDFQVHAVGPVLVREEIDYLRECHMGEELTVDFTSLGLSPLGTRFKVGHEIVRPDGKVAARLVIHGGWLDLKARRLAPPPEALRKTMESVPHAEGFEVLPEKMK
jgi:acyl-CoA thioester hydrolase